MLGEYFTEMVNGIEDVRYVWFDFHQECRKMKYENLSKLMGMIREDIGKHSFFSGGVKKENVGDVDIWTT